MGTVPSRIGRHRVDEALLCAVVLFGTGGWRFGYLFPKSQPGTEGHIHPMLQLGMRRVTDAALVLVKGDENLLANAPGVIINQPIEFTAPKEEHERWFASGQEQFVETCGAISSFVRRWVLPFLSEVSTPADLVRLSEMSDERVMMQRHWYIFVAAAYQLDGRIDQARDLVHRKLGSPGIRKRYAPLFASLGIDGSV